MSDKKYHTIYMIRNLLNHKFYIGKHSTNDPYDDYMGSGCYLRNSIRKYGKENFVKGILRIFKSEEDAYNYEASIVNESLLKNPLCMNSTIGGDGWKSGYIFCKDKNGKIISARSDDPRYLNGELVPVVKDANIGKVTTKDKHGNIFKVLVSDPRLNTGELVGIRKGLVLVVDTIGNTFSVSVDDPRLKSNELASVFTGKQKSEILKEMYL